MIGLQYGEEIMTTC